MIPVLGIILVNSGRTEIVAHHFVASTTVVRLLENSVVEIVQIKLTLQGELVIRIKEVEGDCGPGPVIGCRVPSFPKQLLEFLNMRTLATPAVCQTEVVDSTEINDNEGLVEKLWGRAGMAPVSEMHHKANI